MSFFDKDAKSFLSLFFEFFYSIDKYMENRSKKSFFNKNDQILNWTSKISFVQVEIYIFEMKSFFLEEKKEKKVIGDDSIEWDRMLAKDSARERRSGRKTEIYRLRRE